MLVSPEEIASLPRSRIIGMLITLVTKISPANTAPTSVQVIRNSRFCPLSNCDSRFCASGMVLKVTANTTSEARPQSISRISSTPAKMAMVPLVGIHARNDRASDGCSPRCSARLAS